MNKSGNRSKPLSPSGFTLFEIMISIFIFGIIITVIFGSYTFVFSSSDEIHRSMIDYEMGKTCLNRMTLDLQAAYVTLDPAYKKPDIDDPPDPYRMVGDSVFAGTESFSRFRFTSFEHLPLGKNKRPGIARIVYYVENVDEKNNILKRSDTVYPFDEFEPKKSDPVLCEKVQSLKFIYVDEEEEEFERWDSDSNQFDYATPRLIKIELKFGDDSSSHLLKTMVLFPVYRAKME